MDRIVELVCVLLCWIAVLGWMSSIVFAKPRENRLSMGVQTMYKWDWGFLTHEDCYIDQERSLYICHERVDGIYTSSALKHRYKQASRSR